MTRDYSPDTMPANTMRRMEYACDDAWIREFLMRAEVGRLATHWEEQPFITPLLFWYEPQAHTIFFHSATAGRLYANTQHHARACFEVSRQGKFLPSNVAMEFALQYESVIAFGDLRLVDDEAEKRSALYGMIEKYFPDMSPGEEYRPITDQELKRTSVYSLIIDSWSGKRNWPDRAKQSPEWRPLDPRWF